MKTCFKCLEKKPYSEFYKHPQMSDGYLGKCKACTKSDVSSNRKEKVDYYRDYDRARGARRSSEDVKEYRKRWPRKYRAHTAVNNAIRDGRLFKEPCCECGREEDVHAHHDDYAKPLNIRWLCPPCHFAWHTEHGEAPNGGP